MNIEVLIIIGCLSPLAYQYFTRMWLANTTLDNVLLGVGNKTWVQKKIIKLFTDRRAELRLSVFILENISIFFFTIAISSLFLYFVKNYMPDILFETRAPIVLLNILFSIVLFVIFLAVFEFFLRKRNISRLNILIIIAYTLTYPFVVIFKGIEWLKKKVGHNKTTDITVDLYYQSVDKIKEDKKEIKIFNNALEFSDVIVRTCMVPRNEINSISVANSLEDLKTLFVKTGNSRILVYSETRDSMIGYVSSKDLFKDYEDINSMLRHIDFIPETMPARKQLASFIRNKKSIAIVVDEFGGTSGLVTLEDLIEEIFGDIEDEHDSDNLIEKKLTENEYLFSGRLEVDYLNEKYGLTIPERDDYETLAGYLLYKHERLPDAGKELKFDNFTFTVIKKTATRIELVKLCLDKVI